MLHVPAQEAKTEPARSNTPVAASGPVAHSRGVANSTARLQASVGNQAVMRLQRSMAAGLQPKLEISQPQDSLEQEADRIAERIVAQPVPPIASHAGSMIQRECGTCAPGQPCTKCDEPRVTVQRVGAASPGPHLASTDIVPTSTGAPLAPATRAFFEPRFGFDFSGVRVHTDAAASSSARSIGARAYTVGRNIVFGEGTYVPESAEGTKLLAHELTHVVQQSGASGPRIQRWAQAGNCWHPNMPSNEIGRMMHRETQRYLAMLGFVGEVAIPGASYNDPESGRAGRCDSVGTVPPLRVPFPGTDTFPPHLPPIPTAPGDPPHYAMLGEIKPVNKLLRGEHGDAVAQLDHYMRHHDRYYNGALGSNQYRNLLTNPMLVAGVEAPIRFPPQTLHALPPINGVMYYFCRPSGELSDALEFIIEASARMLRELARVLRNFGEWAWEHVLVPTYHAIVAALKVLLVILIIVVLIAVIVLLAYLLWEFLLAAPAAAAVAAEITELSGVAVEAGVVVPAEIAAPLSTLGELPAAIPEAAQLARFAGMPIPTPGAQVGVQCLQNAATWAVAMGPERMTPARADAILARAPALMSNGLARVRSVGGPRVESVLRSLGAGQELVNTLTGVLGQPDPVRAIGREAAGGALTGGNTGAATAREPTR